MTREALLEQLAQGAHTTDPERTHMEADAAVLAYLNDAEITAAFERIVKWYA